MSSDLALPEPPFPVPRQYGPPLKPICAEAIFDLAQMGLTLDVMAPHLGLSPSRLMERVKLDPSLMAAYRAGLADLIAAAGKTVRARLDANDLDAAKFVLRTRGGWSVQRDVNVNVRQGGSTGPTIDSHVLDLAAAQTALLDGPDPDAPDAEWSEVSDAESGEGMPESDLAAMME